MRFAFCVLLAACACQGSGAKTPAGFEKVAGNGFAVLLPTGWVLDGSNPARVAVRDPGSSAIAVVRTAVYRGPLENAFVALDPLGQGAQLIRHESTVLAGRPGDSAQYAIGDKRANVVVIDGGGVLTMFIAAAGEKDFKAKLPQLVEVLDSYRIIPKKPDASKSAAPTALLYQPWTDPREQAFSTEVPVGYRVQGGLLRTGAIGTRVIMEIGSPDDSVHLFLGDASTGRFILPSELVCSLGNCNGRPMANGDMVAPFQNASDAGADIARHRFGNVQFTGRQERNDLVELRRAKQPHMAGTNNPLSASDIQFTLPDGRLANVTVVTSGFDVPGLGGAWYVDEFFGFVAPKEKLSEGATALAHVIGAMHTNPQWLAAELRSQSAASEQYLAYQRETASLQQRTIEQRWASQDRNNADFRDSLTNTLHLVDPTTNERIDVQSTDRFFFRPVSPANGGTVVTTQQDTNPAPLELQRLLQIER